MQVNILEYLETIVTLYPDKTAFTDERQSITFSQLRSRALSLCANITPFFQKGDPVVVAMGKSVDTVICFLAVLYGGGYYVPVDTDLPLQRIQLIVEHIGAILLLTDQKSAPAMEALPYAGTIKVMDEADVNGLADTAQRWKTVCDVDPIYVIFTSGSTGTPKGIVATHRGVIDYIDAFSHIANIADTDVLGNQAPFDFDASIRDIYVPLKTGASTVLIPKKLFSAPARLFDLLDEQKITTITWVVPALCIPVKMQAFTYKTPRFIKTVVFAGAVMPGKYLAQWQHYIPDAVYINQYGPTEITATCTYHIVDHVVEDDEKLPIGKPYRNTEILLLDKKGNRIIKPGVIGEVYIRGTGISAGYYRDPERTAAAFIQNPTNNRFLDRVYKTGDLACYDEAGLLWFHGRIDSQIKVNGHRVELGEIEHAVKGMPDVEDCCCLFDKEKELLYLFYESTKVNPPDLATYLRDRLPGFMVPRKLMMMEKLPLRPNGKADTQKLKAIMEEN